MSQSASTIDLNADLGESFGAYSIGNDADLLEIVSSANIACGFHAGDPRVLLDTMRLAARHNVRVGAHPGYRDLAGFGRRTMEYDPQDLTAELIYQIGAAQAAARAANTTVDYVKPHGALYNRIAVDRLQADAVIAAIHAVDPSLQLMALAQSPLVAWAKEAGITVIEEVFADRAYNDDGTLLSRHLPGAVHHDSNTVIAQAVAFATGEPITSAQGNPLRIHGDSLCIHGDNPAALDLARTIVQALNAHDIQVRA